MPEIDEKDRKYLRNLIDTPNREGLLRSFNSNPHDKLSIEPGEFVTRICERIYHERNYSGRSLFDDSPELNLNSGDFNMFINYETHLDLVDRRGYTWRGGVFVNEDKTVLSKDGYQKAKIRVLDAFAKKAIDLFSDWQGVNPREATDNRRLVSESLKDYLQ